MVGYLNPLFLSQLDKNERSIYHGKMKLQSCAFKNQGNRKVHRYRLEFQTNSARNGRPLSKMNAVGNPAARSPRSVQVPVILNLFT